MCVASLHFSGYKKRKEIRMSKILALKTDYTNYNLNNNPKKKNFNRLSFGESISPKFPQEAIKLVSEGVNQQVTKKLGIIGWISNILAKREGEVQNQVINAVFTTTLAPFFIAFNPLSKEDEKTKKYTALRQPISALIAITGGFGMTELFNYYLNKLGSEGLIKGIDLRLAPDKGYLKFGLKSELKNKSNTETEAILEKYYKLVEEELPVKQKLKANGKPTRAYLKACRDGYIKSVQKKTKEIFTSLILEDPDDITFDKNTKAILIKGKKLEGSSNIPNMNSFDDLNEYLNHNNLHRMTLGKHMQKEFNLGFLKDGTIKSFSINKQLSEVLAMSFLRSLGLFKKGDIDEEEIRRCLNITRQQEKAGEIDKFIKQGIVTDIAAYEQHHGKQIERGAELLVGENFAKQETITLRQILRVLGYENPADLQALMDKKVIDVINEFAEKLKRAGLKNFGKDAVLATFAKNITANRADRLGSYFKNYKVFVTITTNLVTTAVTCTILNWAYPRILEAFFPSLLKENPKKEGGNK